MATAKAEEQQLVTEMKMQQELTPVDIDNDHGKKDFHPKPVISDNDEEAYQQYLEIMEKDHATVEKKCEAFDALSVLIGFLLAFAFGDIMGLDLDDFQSLLLFIIFSTLLVFTAIFGTLSLIVFSFITIRLRRLLARDNGRSVVYWNKWTVNALRKMDQYTFSKAYTASHATAWYFI